MFTNLLNEQIIVPEIKFLSFTPTEIERFKDTDEFYIIKKRSDVEHLSLNDFIKTEWRKNL